jgi:hypothetical protein
VKAMLETMGVVPTRIEITGTISMHRSFAVPWKPLLVLQPPGAYPANTTAVLTSKVIGRALLPLFGGERNVQYVQITRSTCHLALRMRALPFCHLVVIATIQSCAHASQFLIWNDDRRWTTQ